MFEFRAMVSHMEKMSENENQTNNVLRSKNAGPSVQKDAFKKTAFGDLKNTLSATPSRNILKPQSQVPQSNKFASNILTAQKPVKKIKIKPVFDPNWETHVLQPNDLGRSHTMMWMPSDEQINRIVCPKIIMDPISPIDPKRFFLTKLPELETEPIESLLPPVWDDVPELPIDELELPTSNGRSALHF